MAIKTANGDGSLENTLASKLPYSYGTATPSTSVDGFLWYDENDTPPTPKFWDGAAFQALSRGKIVQVVQDTDSLDRSTTSTSFANVPGMRVTITPLFATSTIYVIGSAYTSVDLHPTTTEGRVRFRIATGGNAVSGADARFGRSYDPDDGTVESRVVLIGTSTPATTSAVDYDMQFLVESSDLSVRCRNDVAQGLMIALEVQT